MPMLKCFRLRRVQRWPEDGMRDVQVIVSQALRDEQRRRTGWIDAQTGGAIFARALSVWYRNGECVPAIVPG